MQDRIFYSICFGFVFGVFLRSFLFVNFYVAVWLGLISFALVLFFSLISKNKWGMILGVFVLTFSLGILRFHSADRHPPVFFESLVGKEASFVGVVVDEPDVREGNQKLTIATNEGKQQIKILATFNIDEYFQYGDEVNFSGTLNKPENFITDQGKDFDYVSYLRKDGIFYLMSYPRVEIISHNNGNKVKIALFSAKEKFLEKMNFAISEPESLLMGGFILGERSSFGTEMRQKFIDTGTIHIVALSGYNVTIVSEWIMRAFSFLPINLAFGAGISGILLFVIMAGGQSTAVRAGTMAILALIARATGRNYDVARALVLAGVIMILFNPFVLFFDVSFQLSFIATVAVIFFTPKIEKYFLWIPKRFGLRDVVSVTSAAYIFVLPFILYKMGNLSLVALPANILILPFIPLTMIFGFITGFAGLVWYVLATPVGYISYLMLHYELGVINFFSSFPFASFSIPNFPLVLTLLIYIYFIYMLFGRSIKSFFTLPG
ncbi:hypothetical protein A2911_02035 [Candidatus Nomurabacteria bacterium RIFCSPLOWO2_01_FULL_40_15]|uniref:ComEC/Rec2-related protein domain-containing protein n=1 Tax=Candidatus Nomurabacteria bacterium RIFCSPLOWO2_01_FULL_40_15 TaxID=1801772 RepID=A0A1F6X8C1_9BACT|nr:MAG: hypothetical protein A2911_02035 [Candidatus Nomurabacteria bacterium RIFCSPLOWO2_01_FULL_40_15]